MRKLLLKGINGLRQAWRGERGIALTEALVTMGITGIVAVAFLTGMSATSKAVLVSQERVTAENLTKSQMEYIRSQQYDEINTPPQYTLLPVGDIPENYAIVITAERLDPEGDGALDDDGLQKVTVVVNHDGAESFRLEGYRMKR